MSKFERAAKHATELTGEGLSYAYPAGPNVTHPVATFPWVSRAKARLSGGCREYHEQTFPPAQPKGIMHQNAEPRLRGATWLARLLYANMQITTPSIIPINQGTNHVNTMVGKNNV